MSIFSKKAFWVFSPKNKYKQTKPPTDNKITTTTTKAHFLEISKTGDKKKTLKAFGGGEEKGGES